jgi:HAD superfamily hydrolase (TIGR01490 family)
MPGAVFSDVEGTLVDGSLPRMLLDVGQRMGLITNRDLARIWTVAIGAQALRGERRRQTQLTAVLRALAGHTEDEVCQLVDRLMPEVLRRLKPRTVARLREHQRAGLPLVLVSAALHPTIARLGAELGGRGEGTRLVVRAGHYTAEVEGPICYGAGKAQRARALIADVGCDPAASYAYGDSGSDIPYLSLFAYPRAVDPDRRLAAEARRRGWLVLRGDAPPAALPRLATESL